MRLGKIFGIRVGLHYSWFLVLALVAWSLASSYFPSSYPDLTTTTYWIIGITAGLLLFACVLAHELSHSLVAEYHGMEVDGITLFFFGGVANAREQGLTPRKEFEIAIAGPVVSVALGALFFLCNRIPFIAPVEAVLGYLARINWILAAFNMIPGLPLDGGRVLRSALWRYSSFEEATWYAANAGKLFATALGFYGVYSLFTGGGGLWFVLLAGFLYVLAEASYDHVRIKQALSGSRVQGLARDATVVDAQENIRSFVHDFEQGELYVVRAGDRVGVVDFDRIKELPKQEWPVRQVSDVTVFVEPAREHHEAFETFMRMQRENVQLLPVVKNGDVQGAVALPDLLEEIRKYS